MLALLSLYLCGLRISEVVGNTTGDLLRAARQGRRETPAAGGYGEGDKTRLVPATNELMVELARYRREQGLSPSPIPGESMPLVLPIGGKKRPLRSRARIHFIVKQVFRHASDRVRQRGADFSGLAMHRSAHRLTGCATLLAHT